MKLNKKKQNKMKPIKKKPNKKKQNKKKKNKMIIRKKQIFKIKIKPKLKKNKLLIIKLNRMIIPFRNNLHNLYHSIILIKKTFNHKNFKNQNKSNKMRYKEIIILLPFKNNNKQRILKHHIKKID